MNFKLLGTTGLKVSTLCLGTMNFGGEGNFEVLGKVDQSAAELQIHKATEAGINFIDTANIYSTGLSEEIVGRAIMHLDLKRDDLIIATKVLGSMGTGPNDKGLSRKHMVLQVEESLRRLRTDYIDLYQIHSADPLTPIEQTLRALDDLVHSGKIRYIGASNMAAWHLMKAMAYSKNYQIESFISLQAHYSLASRDIERELIPMVGDQQLGLLVWSPLSGGLLTGKYNRSQENIQEGRLSAFHLEKHVLDRGFDIVDVLRRMADEKRTSITQLALAWLLQRPAVTSVIIGASTPHQLENNIRSIDVRFSREELAELDSVSRLPVEYPGNIIEALSANRI